MYEPSWLRNTFFVSVVWSSTNVERAGSNSDFRPGAAPSTCRSETGAFEKSPVGTSGPRRALEAEGGAGACELCCPYHR